MWTRVTIQCRKCAKRNMTPAEAGDGAVGEAVVVWEAEEVWAGVAGEGVTVIRMAGVRMAGEVQTETMAINRTGKAGGRAGCEA